MSSLVSYLYIIYYISYYKCIQIHFDASILTYTTNETENERMKKIICRYMFSRITTMTISNRVNGLTVQS